MMKFFRKIRQKFLSEGKTGKYVKYAIGEIALVVIGILIALQINNWNEHTKKFNSWKNYNESLIKDLQQDKTTLEKVTKFIRIQGKAIDRISKRLSSEDATKDTLVSIVRNDLFMDTKAYRPPNNKTFLAMQANGLVEFFDKDTYSLLLALQNQQAIAGSIIQANNATYVTHMENLNSKYSMTEFNPLSGPLVEDYWLHVDKYELFRTAQGYLTAIKMMNSTNGIRYKELLDNTEKVLERVKEVNGD